MSLCLERGGPLRKKLARWLDETFSLSHSEQTIRFLTVQGATLDACHRNAVCFLTQFSPVGIKVKMWKMIISERSLVRLMCDISDFQLPCNACAVNEYKDMSSSRYFSTRHVYVSIHPENKPLLCSFSSVCVFFVFFVSVSLTAKSLVARLMEVDQDQRLTAQEAINHEW